MYMFTAVCSHRFMQLTFLPPLIKSVDNTRALLDASLGKKEHIGFITIGTGPLKPGLGVKKKLPEVGDIHITGIVNNSGATDHVLLQTTRLSMIMTLADTITAALVQTFLTNASPDTLQVPAQPLLHRQIS